MGIAGIDPAGVPGFVLHADASESRIFVRTPPGTSLVKLVVAEPPDSVEVTRVQAPMLHRARTAQGQQGTALLAYRIRLKRRDGHNGSLGISGSYDDGEWSRCPPPLGPPNPPDRAADASACPSFVGRVRLCAAFHRRHDNVPRQLQDSGNERSSASDQSIEMSVQLLGLPPARALVREFGRLSSDPARGWMSADVKDPWGRCAAASCL